MNRCAHTPNLDYDTVTLICEHLLAENDYKTLNRLYSVSKTHMSAVFTAILVHFKFEVRQAVAFLEAIRGKNCFITGGGGTGKSFVRGVSVGVQGEARRAGPLSSPRDSEAKPARKSMAACAGQTARKTVDESPRKRATFAVAPGPHS